MNQALTFILKLQDLLTPGMRQAANVSNTSAAQIEGQFNRINSGGKRMAASVDQLRQRLEAVNRVRFSTTIEREFRSATREVKKLEQQLEKLENKGGSEKGGLLGTFVKGNLIAGGIQSGAAMLLDFGKDTYRTALKNSSLETAINSTTGGMGKEAVDQTWNIADKYGLNYEASLEGVKTLTGGLKSMNLPLKEQMAIFEGVSTGIAAMKLDSETAKGAMLALGQMASKGVVSAEELRGQLGERVPGAFGIAAKAMGVTEAKLGQMLQKGEIGAKEFLPRFAAEMQKTFGAAALENANGPQAIQERFNNAMYKMKASVGEGLMPILTPIITKLSELATFVIPYIQQGLDYVVNLFSSINSGTSEWSAYLEPVKSYFQSVWTTIQSLWKNVQNILSGFTEWLKKSELMKDLAWGIGQLFEGVMAIIRELGNVAQWVWENVIKPIVEKVDWLYSKAKSLLGMGSSSATTVENISKTDVQLAITPAMEAQMRALGISPNAIKKQMEGAASPTTSPLALNPAMSSPYVPAGGESLDNSKSKADSINSGGQRSITINIGKQIEKIEQHIIGGGREAAEELEHAVRETMRRVVYSMNSVAS